MFNTPLSNLVASHQLVSSKCRFGNFIVDAFTDCQKRQHVSWHKQGDYTSTTKRNVILAPI